MSRGEKHKQRDRYEMGRFSVWRDADNYVVQLSGANSLSLKVIDTTSKWAAQHLHPHYGATEISGVAVFPFYSVYKIETDELLSACMYSA